MCTLPELEGLTEANGTFALASAVHTQKNKRARLNDVVIPQDYEKNQHEKSGCGTKKNFALCYKILSY